MKKRILSMMVVFALMVGLLPTTTAFARDDTDPITRAQLAQAIYEKFPQSGGQQSEFEDIGDCTEEQQNAINALASAGILSGTSPTKFNPDGEVTRAQAVVVLWRATGCKSNPEAAEVSYTDVNIGDWYTPAIHALTAAGILQGTGGGTFSPNDSVTIGAVNALIARYDSADFSGFADGVSRVDMLMETYENYKDSPLQDKVSEDFETKLPDIAVCTEEEQQAIKFFEELGVVQGYGDGSGFHPDAAASNLQIAMFLKRCAELGAQQTFSDDVMLLGNEDSIAQAFAFLEAQGIDVTAAQENPNAPGIVADLSEWNRALNPEAPRFSVEGGEYDTPQTVEMTSDAPDAVIYYTTDGTEPTTESTVYTDPIAVNATTTLKAIAVKNNLISDTTSATYTIYTVKPPVFSPVGGTYTSAQNVTITTDTPDAVIYYTTDGSEPTMNSTQYSQPIVVSSSMTLKAIAYNLDGDSSPVATATYTIQKDSGGSSSGGSSSGSSSGGSSTGNKTETTENSDGSTTTTVTSSNGTVTETTKYKDGSKEVIETKKDGTVTTTTTDADGNKTKTVENPDGSSVTTIDNKDGTSSKTTVDENGKTEVSVELPSSVVNTAADNGEAVALPMPSVRATSDSESAPTVTVDLPAGKTVSVEIPVKSVTAGTVAVLVKADGTEEVIKTSLTTSDGVQVALSDGDTVKIVDNSKSFADVPASGWQADAVAFATSRELFSGTGDNTFSPNQSMNRAMIWTVLARFDGAGTTQTGANWYQAGLDWAVANGISDGSNPNGTMTREQLVTMLYRYAGSPATSGNLSAFNDAAQVSSYAVDAMTWATENGILNGDGTGSANPKGQASRVQVAQIMQSFITYQSK